MQDNDQSTSINHDLDDLREQLALLKGELTDTRCEFEKRNRAHHEEMSIMEEHIRERNSGMVEIRRFLELKGRELQVMLDHSNAAIYYMDASGRIARVNKSFSDFFETPFDAVIGWHPLDVLKPEDAVLFHDDRLLMDLGKTVRNQRVTLCRKHRQYVLDIDRVPYRDSSGKVAGLIGFIHDVTDATRIEREHELIKEKLARAEKMEAIGLLAGGVAHDSNNFLTALMGNLELLKSEFTDHPCGHLIDSCMDSAEELHHLVEDLLTLTRAGSTGRSEQFGLVTLQSVLEKFLHSSLMLNYKERFPQVEVSVDFNCDQFPVRGSAHLVNKLLLNLVGNACEAIDGAGKVEVTLENVYVDKSFSAFDLTVEEGTYCRLTIADNGSGIPEDEVKRIFEPFYSSKSFGQSGTGLGMAIVYGVVQKMGGVIDVATTLGQGTEFTLYFPVDIEEIITAKSEQLENLSPLYKEDGSNIKALVIDDHLSQSYLVRAMLADLAVEVFDATNFEEGCRWLNRESFDLIFIDYSLVNEKTFIEAVELMHGRLPVEKVVLCCGFQFLEETEELARKLQVKVMKKPFSLDRMESLLSTVI